MSASVPCSSTEAHMFHPHDAEVEVSCLGLTRCGVLSHLPHHFTETQALWCPGICDCGMGRGKHGPGEHK